MLYRGLKRLIEKGLADGVVEKVDVLYTLGKLTSDEYSELIDLLVGSTTRLN